MRPAAEQQGIEVRVAEARRNLTMMGDRRQLVSAIYNLLDNAVKYSDAGSAVDVRVSVSADGGRVAIDVEDHGIGIPTRDHERIFERFYRVDRGRSRDTGGTGLGLGHRAPRRRQPRRRGQAHVAKARAPPSRWCCPPVPPAQARCAPDSRSDVGDHDPRGGRRGLVHRGAHRRAEPRGLPRAGRPRRQRGPRDVRHRAARPRAARRHAAEGVGHRRVPSCAGVRRCRSSW